MCRGLFRNILIFLLASYVLAKPIDYIRYESDDIAAVESLHHQVRVLPPAGFARQKDLDSESTSPEKRMKNASGQSEDSGYYKTYGSDAEGEKGYLKRTHGKGDQGYKTFDTFHKQDGDKYGYEEHITYGRAQGGHGGGSHGKSKSYSAKGGDDHEGAGTIVDSHYVDGDGESGHYEGGDYAEGASSHYTKGGEGDHYGGDYGDHHSEGSGSRNYSYGDGHGENYSTGGGGGENGSYETHSSYSSGSNGEGNYDDSHY